MSEEKQQNSVKVTGFGALNWDIICQAPQLAKEGQEIELKDINEAPGGSAANTISWLADELKELNYVGAVGNDIRGETILEKMNKKGINTSNILIEENYSTGTAISILDKEKERTLYTYGGAGSKFDSKKIDLKLFKKTDLIHTSSFLSKNLLDVQKKISKLDNIFSFAPGLLCRKLGLKKLKPILSNTDILFINKSELSELLGIKNIKKGIKDLKKIGVEEISVTLGSKGVLASNNQKTIKVEANKVEAVDTTGAGDAYSAGYLLGYIDNLNLYQKTKRGVDMAEKCIKKVGGSNYAGQRP